MSYVSQPSHYSKPTYKRAKERGPDFFLYSKLKETKYGKTIKPIADRAVLVQVLIILGISILLGLILDSFFTGGAEIIIGKASGISAFSTYTLCILFCIIFTTFTGGAWSVIPSVFWGWIIGGIISVLSSEYFSDEIEGIFDRTFSYYGLQITGWFISALGGLVIGLIMNFLLKNFIPSNKTSVGTTKLIIVYIGFALLNGIFYFLFHSNLLPALQEKNLFGTVNWPWLFGVPLLWLASIYTIIKAKKLIIRDSWDDVKQRSFYGSPSAKYDIPFTNSNIQYLNWTNQAKYNLAKLLILGICILLVSSAIVLTYKLIIKL